MARGLLGSAFLDFNANTCTIDRQTPWAWNWTDWTAALPRRAKSAGRPRDDRRHSAIEGKLERRGNPDQISIQDSVAAFYGELRHPKAADSRVSGELGHSVIKTCETIVRKATLKGRAEGERVPPVANLKPTVLVIGGTGFIGKALIKSCWIADAVRALLAGPARLSKNSAATGSRSCART